MDSLTVKLASIAAHAQELLSPHGNVEFDGAAIQGLLSDPEVAEAMDRMRGMALLPEPREEA